MSDPALIWASLLMPTWSSGPERMASPPDTDATHPGSKIDWDDIEEREADER